MNEKNEIDYSAPAPETKDFILRIDDSEVDLDQVRVKMQDLECERNHYRTQLTTCQEQLRQAREYAETQYRICQNGDMIGMDQLQNLIDMLQPALAQQPEQPRSEQFCQWHEDGSGVWETDCKHECTFEYDGPYKNGSKFCCYCGKLLVEIPYVDEDEQPRTAGEQPCDHSKLADGDTCTECGRTKPQVDDDDVPDCAGCEHLKNGGFECNAQGSCVKKPEQPRTAGEQPTTEKEL